MTHTVQLAGTTKIDPLAAGRPGYYEDEVLSVVRSPARPESQGERSGRVTCTQHFCVRRNGHRPQITHWFTPEDLDNDLAGRLADELFAPGWLSGAEVFEHAFTGIVKSTIDDPVEAWATFYDNTLERIKQAPSNPLRVTAPAHSSIEGIVPVYRRAMELVAAGRVLDIGSCFGFLALLLAERTGTAVIASDVSGGTVGLLRTISRRRGLSLGTLVCDAARIPLPDKAVDTVTAIHLLEHLDPEHGRAVLDEAIRLARRRVITAVPFEDEPTAAYGHVRTFGIADIHALGASTGRPFRVEEHHGGWLILECEDRP